MYWTVESRLYGGRVYRVGVVVDDHAPLGARVVAGASRDWMQRPPSGGARAGEAGDMPLLPPLSGKYFGRLFTSRPHFTANLERSTPT